MRQVGNSKDDAIKKFQATVPRYFCFGAKHVLLKDFNLVLSENSSQQSMEIDSGAPLTIHLTWYPAMFTSTIQHPSHQSREPKGPDPPQCHVETPPKK